MRILLFYLWNNILVILLIHNKISAQCKIKLSTNIVVNSEFNSGINNYTLQLGTNGCITSSSSQVFYDNGTLKITVNNNYQYCSPFNWRTYLIGDINGTLVQGQPYVFTCKVRTNSSIPINFDAAIRFASTPYQWIESHNIRAINQWQESCKIFSYNQASTSNIEIAFFFGLVPDGTEIWLDDIYVGTPAGFIEEHKIRVNQIGYQVNYPKEGISVDSCNSFVIKDVTTNSIVYSGNCLKLGKYPTNHPSICNYELDTTWRLQFDSFNVPGQYYIESDNGYTSYVFSINNDIYDSLRKDALRFFYFQRCGQSLLSSHWGNLSRPTCHNQDGNAIIVDTTFTTMGNKDVSGGWHDASDYVKYTFNNALATIFLAKSYLENPLAFSDNEYLPESGNDVPDIVDELAFNANFLFKMQDTLTSSLNFGGVHSKVSTQEWNDVMPQDENMNRYLTPPTTISTAGFVASMCYLYRVFNSVPFYQNLAAPCSTAAFRGWYYLSTQSQYALDPVNNPNGGHINTATYDWYPDIDERIWAASEMYRTFQDTAAHTYFLNNYNYCNTGLLGNASYSHYHTDNSCQSMQYSQHFAWIGFLSYMEAQNPDPQVISTLNNWLMAHADSIVSYTNKDYFSFNLRTWGNNVALLHNSMMLKKAFDVTGNVIYKNTLAKNLDYMLGKNITNYSFVTGYGSRYPVNLYHQHTRNDSYLDLPKGVMVGGPIANSVSPPTLPATPSPTSPFYMYQLYFDTCTAHAKRYLDHLYGNWLNEPAINYNAELVYALYALLPIVNTSVISLPQFPSLMQVYPNPTIGKFIIDTKPNLLSMNFKVSVFNVYGQIVYETGENISLPFEVDLSSMTNGVYFVKIQIGEKFWSQKIMKINH